MIDHISILVSDYEISKKFYLTALNSINYTLKMEFDKVGGMGDDKNTDIWIAESEKISPFHIAFKAENHDQVDKFYKDALSVGGKDNGAPGYRDHYGPDYYAAFVYDPDGNNIEVVCRVKSE